MDNTDVVSLRAYFERLLTEHERWSMEKFSGLDQALKLAREEDMHKFANLNELRREVTTDRSMFVRREVYEAQQNDMNRWRDEASKAMFKVENRVTIVETRIAVWTAAIAAFVVIVQLVSHYFWR